MFVRTKKVGEHRYHQLVENYRQDGRHRQRVLVHLGEHTTAEAALEAAREKLAALEASDLLKKAKHAEWEAGNWSSQIRKHFEESLERYHDGEIPDAGQVSRLMGEDKPAPDTDVVSSTFMGLKHYRKAEVTRTPEQYEYCRAFSFDGEEQEFPYLHDEGILGGPDSYRHTTFFRGNAAFQRWLDSYHSWKADAAKKHAEYDHRRRKLLERIAKLESVVTKMRSRPRASSTV
jgi:hypothetical protein